MSCAARADTPAPVGADEAGWYTRPSWGCSSAGRALRSHRRGQGFESPHLHHLFEFQRAVPSAGSPRGAGRQSRSKMSSIILVRASETSGETSTVRECSATRASTVDTSTACRSQLVFPVCRPIRTCGALISRYLTGVSDAPTWASSHALSGAAPRQMVRILSSASELCIQSAPVVFLNDSCALPAQELRAGVVRGGSRGVRSSGRFDAGGDRERFSGQHFECPAALLVVYGGAESFELVACHQHCPEAGNEAGRGDLDVVAGAADRP